MEIYKQQARDSIDAAIAQRLLREHAQAERVRNKQARPVTAFPPFKLEESSPTDPSPSTIPQITQDNDYDSTPTSNKATRNSDTHTRLHAPMYGNPRLQGSIHTATSRLKEVSDAIPV